MMGIQCLLQTLKSIQTKISISKYAGSTVGVDAYCWLHKGIHSCLNELAWNKPTTKYVEYCIKRVRMLKKFNVRPLIVFDGGYLLAKSRIKLKRERERQENRKIGCELFRKGRVRESFPYFKKSVDVTPEMAHKFIEALRAEEVAYVVAPYEADAQLAYLEKKRHIAAIITEDSDLLVFGCRTVIYKLEPNGEGIEICRDKFGDVDEINMLGWTDKEFRHMSMLAGCDYLPSIPGIGLKSAHKYLRKYKTVDKIIQYLKDDNKIKVPSDYEDNFKRAELVFLYQRVFDIETECLVTLNPVPDNLELDISSFTNYIGPNMDENIALGIAIGDINPVTMEPTIQVKEKAVEARSSSPPPDFSDINNPFTYNPFDSVETLESQENYVLNVPLFEKALNFSKDSSKTNGQSSVSSTSKKQKICTDLTSKTINIPFGNSNPISYYQSSSNNEEKIFEMEFIEPLKNNDAQKIRVLVRCKEIFSTVNNAELTECERLVTEGWANKYSRKRKKKE